MEAAALEQLGYQSNQVLQGMHTWLEPRNFAAPNGTGRTMISADVMSAMSLSQLLDYLAVRLNGSEADGENFKMNLIIKIQQTKQ